MGEKSVVISLIYRQWLAANKRCKNLINLGNLSLSILFFIRSHPAYLSSANTSHDLIITDDVRQLKRYCAHRDRRIVRNMIIRLNLKVFVYRSSEGNKYLPFFLSRRNIRFRNNISR